MKRFNQFRIFLKWSIALFFGILLLLITFFWVEMVSESKIWMLLIFLVVPVIQFLMTPLFTLLNVYTYYSPMVVTMSNSKKSIDLHNGTSFDYLLEMNMVKPGIQWKHTMLCHYLVALLNIIEQIERGDFSKTVVIRGSSYFLNARSAKKFGFSVEKTSFSEKLNIVLNYVDLLWMYSLTHGKLTFPDLLNISTVSIQGGELLNRKEKISAFINRLNRSNRKHI